MGSVISDGQAALSAQFRRGYSTRPLPLTKSGHFTSLRRLFAKMRVNKCCGDVTPPVEGKIADGKFGKSQKPIIKAIRTDRVGGSKEMARIGAFSVEAAGRLATLPSAMRRMIWPFALWLGSSVAPVQRVSSDARFRNCGNCKLCSPIVARQNTTFMTCMMTCSGDQTNNKRGTMGAAVTAAKRDTSFSPNGTFRISCTTV